MNSTGREEKRRSSHGARIAIAAVVPAIPAPTYRWQIGSELAEFDESASPCCEGLVRGERWRRPWGEEQAAGMAGDVDAGRA